MLTRSSVALQLSDHTFTMWTASCARRNGSAIRTTMRIRFADAIRNAVLSSVRALLDHSAECPIRDVKDVDYRAAS